MGGNIGALIVSTPGVVGGRPRIDGTRVSVRTIAAWYKKGYTPEEIADQLEQLTLPQVYAALTYYHANRPEIEADLAAEETEYDRLLESHYEYRKQA